MTLQSLLEGNAARYKERGLWRELKECRLTGPVSALVDGREVVNFASNDYLGLAHDDRLLEAAVEATRIGGCGSGASRLVTGNNPWYGMLEDKLAALKGTEAAIVFSSGYAACTGTIAALAGRGDVVFADRLCHAGIIDGCVLSGAELRRYPHLDLDHLRGELIEARGFTRRFIVTDTVFSMDGDLADIPALAGLAEEHDAILITDDAHGTGVLGESGAGAISYLGAEGRVPVQIGTLSKALGCAGGFVAGSADLVEFLVNRARPMMFSTALPPGTLAAASSALDIVAGEPQLRERLAANSGYFRSRSTEAGIKVGDDPTPIAPVLLGSAVKALECSAMLLAMGYLAPAIRPPAVPESGCRVRVTLSAHHTRGQIDGLVAALSQAVGYDHA